MKTGITVATEAPDTYPALLRGDAAENIRIAAALGAETVELHLPDPSAVDVASVLEACQETGVSISAIGTGLACVLRGISLTSPDGAVRGRAIDTLREYTDLAAQIGGVVILGSIRGKADGKVVEAEYGELLIQNLRLAAQYAQTKGVTLVMEVINRYELRFLNNAGQVAVFLDKLGCANVKMHLDTFHMNIEETSMVEAILTYGPLIGHVHAADNTRSYPGSGRIDFKEVAVALRVVGYQGAFSMECLPMPDAETAIRRGLYCLDHAVALAK